MGEEYMQLSPCGRLYYPNYGIIRGDVAHILPFDSSDKLASNG